MKLFTLDDKILNKIHILHHSEVSVCVSVCAHTQVVNGILCKKKKKVRIDIHLTISTLPASTVKRWQRGPAEPRRHFLPVFIAVGVQPGFLVKW